MTTGHYDRQVLEIPDKFQRRSLVVQNTWRQNWNASKELIKRTRNDTSFDQYKKKELKPDFCKNVFMVRNTSGYLDQVTLTKL